MSKRDAAARLRDDIHSLRLRDERRDLILAGELFPELDDLRAGLPFHRGSLRGDCLTFIKTLLLSELEPGLREALELALANPAAATIRAAADRTHYADDTQRRLDLYAGVLGDPVGRDRTVRRGFENIGEADLGAAGHTVAFALGLSLHSPQRFGHRDTVDTDAVDRLLQRGFKMMAEVRDLSARLGPALAGVSAADDDDLDELMTAVDEDRAEILVADGIPDAFTGNPPVPEVPGAIVVPALDPKGGTSHTRDIRKSWVGIAGERLPIMQVGDLAASAARLVQQWPYAEELIHSVLGDLSHGGDVVFRPTLFVGEPGTGKSALARAIADEFGLANQEYDMAGQADSSLMGTSSRFSTAEESVPLQLVKQAKSATVCIIWDEIDKVADGHHNGSAQDALLPYLVPRQAQRMRDPALGVDVDLSYVSHFATANKLQQVPMPLRDRMRVIRMPSPGPQHIGVLTEHILDDLAKRRKLDRAWLPPLAEDELDVIRDAWTGGSIRRLERYVEITVAKRDQHLIGRA